MKNLIKGAAAAVIKAFARMAAGFNHIFRHDGSADNPAGRGTANPARPRRRLVDGVDADRFTVLCAVLVVGFVTLIGAILLTAALRSGGRQIPLPQESGSRSADGFTLSLGGSIMPSQDMMDSAKTESGYNFHNYLSELSGTMTGDITIAGLSGQIDAYGQNEALGGFTNGRNYPRELAQALALTGVKYVCGANTHAFANGYDGMCASVTHLHTQSIGVIGLTNNDPRKLNTTVVRAGGVGVGIAGYNCVESPKWQELTEEQKTYIAQVERDADVLAERAAADIAVMRASGAEFIILCVSWGGGTSLAPDAFIRDAAAKLVEAGADVVVGYGPWITMETQVIPRQSGGAEKDCYVFYSLGMLFGDGQYTDKTAAALSKSPTLTDAQKKQLADKTKYAASVNQAMARSMTVDLKVTRAKNGTVRIESAVCEPIFTVKNTAQGEENAYLKYMAVRAAQYVAAEERPAIFADDRQWQLCREAYTAICELAAKTDGKLIPAGGDTNEETDVKL